ncbi:MAG TPA: hypothetical protein VHT75_20480 [Acidimicrobiales bacterium]|jgi:hypothetical protein|nr:hypothetical protein [Acidimicrobiales bacterium]
MKRFAVPNQKDTPTREKSRPRPAVLDPDTVIAWQRAVGNSAVAGRIQRLKETAENRAGIQPLKQQFLGRFPKGFKRWDTLLAAANSLEALRASVNAVAPAAARQEAGEAGEGEQEEAAGPETVMTTDPYTKKRIGPFNGRSGPSSEVKGAKDYVYYDQAEKYCISRDRDEHAGAAYKLFKRTGTGWQRLDTIGLDGAPMGRG